MKHYYFFGELDIERTQSIVSFILECKKSNEEGVMMINSPGGLTSGLDSIYATLVDTGVRLTTVGMGTVASAAAILFAMGDERMILPGTEYLIHHPRQKWEHATVQEYDFEIQLERIRLIEERFGRMLEKTRITNDVIKEKCDKGSDWILTPEELKEYCVITRENYQGWSNLVIASMKDKNH